MKGLISIIVPIYNVEPYLNKCVDSIINQTYRDLEIILVDDGSPDHCGMICDEYAKQDSRIKVIHKVNGGLSDARNAGLDIMSGDYVGFVDSDDWIEPTMYEKLLNNLLQSNSDISFGGVSDDQEINGVYTLAKGPDYVQPLVVKNSIDAMKNYFLTSWAAWDKLYKSYVFDDVRFPKGEINEDEAIVLQILDKCQLACYTNEVFYHYIRRNNNSITASSFSIKKLAFEKHCKDNLMYVLVNYEGLYPYALKRFSTSVIWSLTEIAQIEDQREYTPYINQMIEDLRNFKIDILKNSLISKMNKIKVLFILMFGFKCFSNVIKKRRKITK